MPPPYNAAATFNYYGTGGALNPLPGAPAPSGQSGYNVTPGPYGYSGTFGGVPGVIGIPNPYSDLSSVYPNLSGTNAAASTALLSELQGQVSPETQALLQDKGAAFGVSSGMPGSGLATNRTLRDLGLTSEELQGTGIRNYSSLIPTVSGTQTVNPALQAEIAARNATTLAAPIPSQAASYAQQLFDRYLNQLRGPGGSTSALAGPTSGTGSTALGFGAGTLGPYTDPRTTGPGGEMSDQEFNDWQNYVIGGGDLPQYGTATTGSYDAGTPLADYVNSPFDEGDF